MYADHLMFIRPGPKNEVAVFALFFLQFAALHV
jgi:hypothetical protein